MELGFFGLLEIVFIILRLVGVIHWNWILVILLGPLAFCALVLLLISPTLTVFVIDHFKRRNNDKKGSSN